MRRKLKKRTYGLLASHSTEVMIIFEIGDHHLRVVSSQAFLTPIGVIDGYGEE